jgi:hypothetical protein
MLMCPISAPADAAQAAPLGSNSNEATLRNGGAIQVRQCDRSSSLSRYRVPTYLFVASLGLVLIWGSYKLMSLAGGLNL